jgi:hypothetical protein
MDGSGMDLGIEVGCLSGCFVGQKVTMIGIELGTIDRCFAGTNKASNGYLCGCVDVSNAGHSRVETGAATPSSRCLERYRSGVLPRYAAAYHSRDWVQCWVSRRVSSAGASAGAFRGSLRGGFVGRSRTLTGVELGTLDGCFAGTNTASNGYLRGCDHVSNEGHSRVETGAATPSSRCLERYRSGALPRYAAGCPSRDWVQ